MLCVWRVKHITFLFFMGCSIKMIIPHHIYPRVPNQHTSYCVTYGLIRCITPRPNCNVSRGNVEQTTQIRGHQLKPMFKQNDLNIDLRSFDNDYYAHGCFKSLSNERNSIYL